MNLRNFPVAVCALLLLTAFAFAQSPLTVRMLGSPQESVVTPRALAIVSGLEINETTIGPLTGESTLAGYLVELDGKRCPITQVTPEGIVFLVPESVRLSVFGRASPLYVQGPETSRFTDVRVERFWPLLDRQQPAARDPDADCCAVATGGMFPILYVGQPIPVGPGRFNYVTMLAKGFVTGQVATQWPYSPLVLLERVGERYELAAEAYDVAGFRGTERVAFFAPPCANGEYHVSVVYAGYVTQSALIRFSSNCTVQGGRRPSRIQR